MVSFIRTDRLGKDTIEFGQQSKFPSSEVEAVLDEAAKDPYLGDFIYKKKLSDMVVFSFDGEVAGFAIPRKDSDGHFRTGPIFVKQGFRRKGIAKQFAKDYFEGKKGRAWIEESNLSSQHLYTSIGFQKTKKSMKDDDGVILFEYLKEA